MTCAKIQNSFADNAMDAYANINGRILCSGDYPNRFICASTQNNSFAKQGPVGALIAVNCKETVWLVLAYFIPVFP